MYARYVRRVFPTQQATAQGAPAIAGQMALLVSQYVVAVTIEHAGVAAGWVLLGFCMFGFSICFCTAYAIAERGELPKLSDSQKKLLPGLETGKDVDAFIEDACARLRHSLQANRDQLWNGTIQSVYLNWLETHPKTRRMDQLADEREYLEEVYELLFKYSPAADVEEFS